MHFYPHMPASFSCPRREPSATAKSQCLNDHKSAKKIVQIWDTTLFSSWKALSNEPLLDPTCNLRFFRPPSLYLPGVLKWVFFVLNDKFYDIICIPINFNPLSRTIQKLFRCPGIFSSLYICIYIYIYIYIHIYIYIYTHTRCHILNNALRFFENYDRYGKNVSNKSYMVQRGT